MKNQDWTTIVNKALLIRKQDKLVEIIEYLEVEANRMF